MTDMHVTLVVPFYDQQRGNTITVNRISSSLRSRGLKTKIINATQHLPQTTLTESTDIIHGFHAYQFQQFVKKLPYSPKSYVITMTGTDLNKDLFLAKRRDDVIKTVTEASSVIVFEERAKSIIIEQIPNSANKIFVIPQGVSQFKHFKSKYIKEEGTFLFLLPAGLCKTKNITGAIAMLQSVKKAHPHLRLWIVGPIIEFGEAERVKQMVEQNSDWVQYLGHIPHEEMGALYKQSDVVLNTSYSEGQPSAILEAMSLGIPPIVSNNNGNQSIVIHEETGLIYQSETEFAKYAQALIRNPQLRKNLGKQGKLYVKHHHSLTQEVRKLLSVYNSFNIL